MTESEPGSQEFKIVLSPNDALLVQTVAHFNKMTRKELIAEALRVGVWYLKDKAQRAFQEPPIPDFPVYNLREEFPWGEDMQVSVENPMVAKLHPRKLLRRVNRRSRRDSL